GTRIQKRDVQGNWSVIAAAGNAPGQVGYVSALAVDAVGNLYIAVRSESGDTACIEQRDTQGNWSVIATAGNAPGRVGYVFALGVDTNVNLYVADGYPNDRIQKRDAQGNWSILATP